MYCRLQGPHDIYQSGLCQCFFVSLEEIINNLLKCQSFLTEIIKLFSVACTHPEPHQVHDFSVSEALVVDNIQDLSADLLCHIPTNFLKCCCAALVGDSLALFLL